MLRRDSDGFALVAVLGCIAILALVSSVAISNGRTARNQAIQISENVISEETAEGALALTAARLFAEDEAARWYVDGGPYEVDWAGKRVKVDVRHISQLLNLNFSPREVLAEGLYTLGVGEQRAQAVSGDIVQWRSGGSRVGETGGRFLSVFELRGLPSLTTSDFDRVLGHLTVVGRGAGPGKPALKPMDKVIASAPSRRDYDGVTRQSGDKTAPIYRASIEISELGRTEEFYFTFAIRQHHQRLHLEILERLK